MNHHDGGSYGAVDGPIPDYPESRFSLERRLSERKAWLGRVMLDHIRDPNSKILLDEIERVRQEIAELEDKIKHTPARFDYTK